MLNRKVVKRKYRIFWLEHSLYSRKHIGEDIVKEYARNRATKCQFRYFVWSFNPTIQVIRFQQTPGQYKYVQTKPIFKPKRCTILRTSPALLIQ
jgi:hypothetical protein